MDDTISFTFSLEFTIPLNMLFQKMMKFISGTKKNMFLELPGEVLDSNFSLFDARDLAKVHILSKEFAAMSDRIRVLNLFSGHYQPADVDGVMTFVDRFLIRRETSGFPLQILKVDWVLREATQGLDETHIHNWIESACISQLQNLYVRVYPNRLAAQVAAQFSWLPSSADNLFEVPLAVYSANTLVNLHLESVFLKLPSSASTQLETLKLIRVRVDLEDLGHWISSCCWKLRKLILHEVLGLKTVVLFSDSLREVSICANELQGLHTVNVTAPGLQTFNLFFDPPFRNGSLFVHAPKLETLELRGRVIPTTVSMGVFACLRTANLYWDMWPSLVDPEQRSAAANILLCAKFAYQDLMIGNVFLECRAYLESTDDWGEFQEILRRARLID